jgi:hypothetical protein
MTSQVSLTGLGVRFIVQLVNITIAVLAILKNSTYMPYLPLLAF